jgi:hypothetical protein
MNLTDWASGGHIWTLYSSGGGPSATGSFGIYDSTAGGNRFVINTSGNVGIGTAAPAYRLEAKQAANGVIQSMNDPRLKARVSR